MKVISGKYKGRSLKGFDVDGTRPTMDRVKESVFGMIQGYIKESVVLDLYSGTGNLAIEALSNGAKKAYLVDHGKIAIEVIKSNLKALNISNAIVLKDDALHALKSFINKESFDVIFLDPPYNTNLLEKTLKIMNDCLSLINKDGIIVCETELLINYNQYNNFVIYKEKTYGTKKVTILKIKKN